MMDAVVLSREKLEAGIKMAIETHREHGVEIAWENGLNVPIQPACHPGAPFRAFYTEGGLLSIYCALCGFCNLRVEIL